MPKAGNYLTAITSQATCGAKQNCDLNGCAGTYDANSNRAYCRGNFAGCECNPTQVSACSTFKELWGCWLTLRLRAYAVRERAALTAVALAKETAMVFGGARVTTPGARAITLLRGE